MDWASIFSGLLEQAVGRIGAWAGLAVVLVCVLLVIKRGLAWVRSIGAPAPPEQVTGGVYLKDADGRRTRVRGMARTNRGRTVGVARRVPYRSMRKGR